MTKFYPTEDEIKEKLPKVFKGYPDGMRFRQILPRIQNEFSEYQFSNERSRQLLMHFIEKDMVYKSGTDGSPNSRYHLHPLYQTNIQPDEVEEEAEPQPEPEPQPAPPQTYFERSSFKLGNLTGAIWVHGEKKYAVYEQGRIVGYVRTLQQYEWVVQGKTNLIHYSTDKNIDDHVHTEILAYLITLVTDDMMSIKTDVIERVLDHLRDCGADSQFALDYQPMLIKAIRTHLGFDSRQPQTIPF